LTFVTVEEASIHEISAHASTLKLQHPSLASAFTALQKQMAWPERM